MPTKLTELLNLENVKSINLKMQTICQHCNAINLKNAKNAKNAKKCQKCQKMPEIAKQCKKCLKCGKNTKNSTNCQKMPKNPTRPINVVGGCQPVRAKVWSNQSPLRDTRSWRTATTNSKHQTRLSNRRRVNRSTDWWRVVSKCVRQPVVIRISTWIFTVHHHNSMKK